MFGQLRPDVCGRHEILAEVLHLVTCDLLEIGFEGLVIRIICHIEICLRGIRFFLCSQEAFSFIRKVLGRYLCPLEYLGITDRHVMMMQVCV